MYLSCCCKIGFHFHLGLSVALEIPPRPCESHVTVSFRFAVCKRAFKALIYTLGGKERAYFGQWSMFTRGACPLGISVLSISNYLCVLIHEAGYFCLPMILIQVWRSQDEDNFMMNTIQNKDVLMPMLNTTFMPNMIYA